MLTLCVLEYFNISFYTVHNNIVDMGGPEFWLCFWIWRSHQSRDHLWLWYHQFSYATLVSVCNIDSFFPINDILCGLEKWQLVDTTNVWSIVSMQNMLYLGAQGACSHRKFSSQVGLLRLNLVVILVKMISLCLYDTISLSI